MVPTKTRNHSAIFLSYSSDGLLFDCGEGTQRQLKLAGIKLTKVNKIFISHWHGDHVLGLPGLIQSIASEEYTKKLTIYGPPGTIEKIESLNKVFVSDKKIDIEIKEISAGIILETPEYKIISAQLDHKTQSFGFSFIENDRRRIKVKALETYGLSEGPLLGKLQKGQSVIVNKKTISPDDVTYIVKGKKFTYIADTKICENAIVLSKESDILICESTYQESDKPKADEYSHMTSADAATVASHSDSKRLILTHISQRYKDTTELLNDAIRIFPETELGFDLMKIKI